MIVMQDKDYRFIPFRNQQPLTPFAPQWQYAIGEKFVDIDVDQLKDLVLEKEPEILSIKGDLNDGSTGLGVDSTTARYGYYNVLDWDHPEIKKLKAEIYEFHQQYLREVVGAEPFNVKVMCWCNIMRKGDRIHKHLHGLQSTTYLSGHFTISCNETKTLYVNPYEHKKEDELFDTNNELVYQAENVPRKLTLFPSYIPHLTTEHKSDDERITLAFDLTPFDVNSDFYIPL